MVTVHLSVMVKHFIRRMTVRKYDGTDVIHNELVPYATPQLRHKTIYLPDFIDMEALTATLDAQYPEGWVINRMF